MLGKTEGKRGRRQRQRMKWFKSITDSMDMSKLGEIVGDRGDWLRHQFKHLITRNEQKVY